MGTSIYRVTGIVLSTVIALLGVAVTILLYYAGQDGLDLFYKDSTYRDEQHRIHKRMPTDDWYGVLILRGWAFGFIYVVPGLTGITASLFFNKCFMVVHLLIGTLALVAGSFLYTAGVYAFIVYKVFVANGTILKYNTWPWDCEYIRYDDTFEQKYVDERCTVGRRTTIYLIVAAAVTFVAWLFVLSELLYCGFTFHNIGKDDKKSKKSSERPPTDRPRRRNYQRQRAPPSESTLTTDVPAATASDNISNTSQTDTTPTFSTLQKRESPLQNLENSQTDGAMGHNITDGSSADEKKDVSASVEMVQVVEIQEVTPL